MTILVSGIGKRNALIRLISEEANKFGVKVVGGDAQTLPPARIEVSDFSVLPMAYAPEFPDRISQLIAEKDVKAHLTLIDPEIPVLGKIELNRRSLLSYLLHPRFETASVCEDKYEFSKSMKQSKLPSFETSLKPLDQFPFIRKDRKGSAASGFKIFANPQDLEDIGPGDFIYQPFCGGRHFCVDAYFSILDGRLVDFCVKEILNKSKGESFLLQSMRRGNFDDILNALSKALPLRGIVNFDFLEENGQFKVLEINCRIGGNYPASQQFGCNLLKPCLDEVFEGGTEIHYSNYEYVQSKLVTKYFAFSNLIDPLTLQA